MKDILSNAIKNYSFDLDGFVLSDQLIYDFVRDNPSNKNVDNIIAKLYIIGHVYSATLERINYKKQKRKLNTIALYDKTAKEISKLNIDNDLNKLSKMDINNDDAFILMLEIHNKLTKCFCKVTGNNKISLASKYLHFHFPNHFFIFDSIVNSNIGKFVDTSNYSLIKNSDNINLIYAKYCIKAREILEYINNDDFINRKNISYNNETLIRCVDRIIIRNI